MFIVAIFRIVKQCNQPKYPSTNELIKKMWYTYTIEYFSATKKSKIMSFAGKWMKLEILMLSEISQTQKDKSRPNIYQTY
jgi:superfamily II DNA/RNA helicase